jgi:steroid 5-alpha reductase family enzyme
MISQAATEDVALTSEASTKPPEGSVEHVRILTGFRTGALPLMVLLPPLVYYMWICVAFYGGDLQIPTNAAALGAFVSHITLPGWQSWAIVAGWYALQIGLQLWAPGKWVEGTRLRDGSRLKYKMNGWFSWWFTIIGAALLWYFHVLPGRILADRFGELLTIINIGAFVLSGYLYWYGRKWPKGESNAGTLIYDYFMGTALNPRSGSFDFKLFFEARPGLILWVLINFSFMAMQYDLHGTVTLPMILVCAFHFLYIADYYFNEPRILSTMDIKHENFGWMLAWGDAVWVPFTYTLQAMYLVNHMQTIPVWGAIAVVALNLGGFYVFRAVNSQKDNFRANPDAPVWGRKPEFIKTERGTLLLTSGWWGLARHANYMGDLMMAWAWCLPCGFRNLLPYFYVVYFTWLLVHRERRDDKMCAAKYGKDWDAYKKRVPWHIVPHIY